MRNKSDEILAQGSWNLDNHENRHGKFDTLVPSQWKFFIVIFVFSKNWKTEIFKKSVFAGRIRVLHTIWVGGSFSQKFLKPVFGN